MTQNVLCVGHINWDVVLHTETIPDPDHSEAISEDYMNSGGSATNTALALSSLGVDVNLLGSIADDKYGQFVQNALEESEVSPSLVRNAEATTLIYAIITEGADPRYLARNQEIGTVSIDSLEKAVWDEIDHLHTTSFSPKYAGNIAQQAKEDGKTVSFNPSQGYGNNKFPDVIDAADVIFLNEREAALFRQRHNFGEIASEKCITITHGSAGSTTYTPNGVYNHSGFSMVEIEDTIGAGDSFVAGFLSEWLSSENCKMALAKANACGASAVRCVGAPDELDTEWIKSTLESDT